MAALLKTELGCDEYSKYVYGVLKNIKLFQNPI